MAVEGIDGPVEEGVIGGGDVEAAGDVYLGIVDAMVVVETDGAAGKEVFHAMAEDDVFGDAALQSVRVGEQPETVAEHEGLLDVVGAEQDGFVLFGGQTME
jgi:hypothetical protein